MIYWYISYKYTYRTLGPFAVYYHACRISVWDVGTEKYTPKNLHNHRLELIQFAHCTHRFRIYFSSFRLLHCTTLISMILIKPKALFFYVVSIYCCFGCTIDRFESKKVFVNIFRNSMIGFFVSEASLCANLSPLTLEMHRKSQLNGRCENARNSLCHGMMEPWWEEQNAL